jgi:hypothetical protein
MGNDNKQGPRRGHTSSVMDPCYPSYTRNDHDIEKYGIPVGKER